jgi:hypothetical protein
MEVAARGTGAEELGGDDLGTEDHAIEEATAEDCKVLNERQIFIHSHISWG